jgi:hypothetical protein
MVVPLLIVAGIVFGRNTAAKFGARAVATAIPTGLKLKNLRHERNDRLGINPELNKNREKMRAEYIKKEMESGLYAALKSRGESIEDSNPDGFVIERIPKEFLPSSLGHLDGVWFLTRREWSILIDTVRRESVVSENGPWFEELQKLASAYGIPLKRLTDVANGGLLEIDYDDLRFFSDNRLTDPVLSAMFEEPIREAMSQKAA